MFEVGWTEMLVIAIVMIVVVGPKDLPNMLRNFGRTTAKLRAMAADFQKQFNEALKEAELDDVKKSVDELRGLNPTAEIRRQLNPFEKAAVDVNYARSFVPSYGGGGTLSNEEVTSNVHMPIGRRMYAEASASWRSNEPLVAGVAGELPLRSLWLGGVVGYAAQPWLRIEGVYGRTQQRIDRPGGDLERNRIGVQVVTAKPVRIR